MKPNALFPAYRATLLFYIWTETQSSFISLFKSVYFYAKPWMFLPNSLGKIVEKNQLLHYNRFVIETARLILRPMAMSDIDDLLEYQSHPEIVRYIPWPERTREQVVAAAEKTISMGKQILVDEGDFIVLVWELKDLPEFAGSAGKVIGQSSMALKSVNDQCADIGWVTHQDFHRRGLAFEATQALMKYAFENFPLHRVIADIDMRVPESAYLAEKLGMRQEGSFIEGEFFKGEWCDMWLYAILNREFHVRFQY
jgi:aminoglycoside 6'-N-acetyltransferase